MRNETRLVLDMGSRIGAFSQAHPFDNPGYTAAVTRLEAQLARAETLLQQEVSGHLEVSASVASKKEVRNTINGELLFLGGIAAAAAAEEPGLAERLQTPAGNVSHRRFLTEARVAVAQALPRKSLFLKYGMTGDLLEGLTTQLDQFEQLINQKNAGRAAHVGARADLERATEAIMRIADQLDALNRFRLRNDAELLAAWKSVRDVAWRSSSKAATPQAGSQARPAA
jgi:hypothetical protein